jgi:hypothetical protein
MKFLQLLKDWWIGIQNLFTICIEISLIKFIFVINILVIKIKIETKLPYLFNYWNNIYNTSIKFSQNKYGEIQLTFANNLKTGININKYIHNDHTPFNIEISIVGFTIVFTVFDNRHWNDENNKYEEYNE